MNVIVVAIRNIEMYPIDIFSKYSITLICNEALANVLPPHVIRLTHEVVVLKEEFSTSTGMYQLNQQHFFDAVSRLTADQAPTDWRIVNLQEANQDIAALARERYGIPGMSPAVLEVFRNKAVMKRRLDGAGVRTPHFKILDLSLSSAEQLAYLKSIFGERFVVKPISAASSKDVYIYEGDATFELYYTGINKRAGGFEAEEFIEGGVFQCDFVVAKNSAVFMQCAESSFPNFELQRGRNLGCITLPESSDLYEEILRFADLVSGVLGRHDGAYHLELFLTATGLVFLEIAARPPGGYTIPIYERKTGVNMLALDLAAQCGSLELFDDPVTILQHAFFMALPLRGGIVQSLHRPELESEFAMQWRTKIGAEVSRSKMNQDFAGMVMAWNTDYDTLRRDFDYMKNNYVPITYFS